MTLAVAVEGLALGEPVSIDISELDPSRYPVGTPVVIEGRYAGRISNNMALHGSSVIFVLKPDAEVSVRIDWLNPESYLRVEGLVAFRETTNTYYISVYRVESVENLRQRVASAMADPRATSESLYEVGIAARRWAKGHPNDRLLELAEGAITKGLRMEDLRLGSEDWEGYLRLAEKAEDMLGKSSLPEYYVRWGIRTFILSKGKRRAETYYEAARKAERLMPESPFAEILLENGFSIEKGLHDESGRRNYYALAEKALELLDDSSPGRQRILEQFGQVREALTTEKGASRRVAEMVLEMCAQGRQG